MKGRLYFQNCCHHLLLVFQADENMCNPFETIQLLKKKLCILSCNYFSLKKKLRLIWHHVTCRTDRAKSFQESALLGCCLKKYLIYSFIFQSLGAVFRKGIMTSPFILCMYYIFTVRPAKCMESAKTPLSPSFFAGFFEYPTLVFGIKHNK